MSYFIKVDDSTGIRRRVLEGTKEVIMMLKRYQLLLETRDKKKQLLVDLTTEIRELKLLLGKLEKIVPASSLKELQAYLPKKRVASKKTKEKKSKKVEEKKVEEKPKIEEKKLKPKPLTELDKLEKALSDIDKRLSTL